MSASSAFSTGSSKGKETTESTSADRLSDLMTRFANETGGLRGGLIDTMQEILGTGGTNVPIISSAVESSKRAASKTLTQTDAELARTRLAGTPFGANTRANVVQEGNLSSEMVKNNFAQRIFDMIPGFLTGTNQTIVGGYGSSIPGNTSTRSKGDAMGQTTALQYGGGGGK